MEMRKLALATVGAVGLAVLAPAAMAAPIYTSFGSLPGANFGGTGIPNDAVAKTEVFINGTEKVTIALTAHQRFFNPVVTNNGAGDYFAGPGQNCGVATDPVGCPSASQGSLWNFAFYISTENATFADYTFTLYYDFNPGANTAFNTLGSININNSLVANAVNPASVTLLQDSQNLLFSGFATTIPGIITAPAFGPFNPNALGEYNFYIGFQKTNLPTFAGTVGIDVNVVPVPAAVWLFGSGLGLLAWVRRRAAA